MDPLPLLDEPIIPPGDPNIPVPESDFSTDERTFPKRHGRNLILGSVPAVVTIIISATIFLLLKMVVVPRYHLAWMFEHAEATAPQGPPPLDPKAQTAPALLMTLIMVGSLYGGFLAALIALSSMFFSREAREKMVGLLGRMAVRPLPAINLLDVIALVTLIYSVFVFYAVGLQGLFDGRRAHLMKPMMMVAFDLAQATAVMAAIVFAAWRARGWHGALGFWPPWSSAYVLPKQPIWKDILLGVAVWPLTFWISSLVTIVNKIFVNEPDRHSMISEFAHHPPPLTTAVYVFGATFGAAFLEETLFRGIIYNSLRRIMGGPAGALLAGFIFAYAHGLKTDLPGLFVLGMVMTWLYDKTGRLVAGMAFHFTNNFIMLIYVLVLYNQ